MTPIQNHEENSDYCRPILETCPHAEIITKIKGSVFTFKKKLVNNPDENRIVQYLICSLIAYFETFHPHLKIAVKLENNFDSLNRKSRQFFSELLAYGEENAINDHYDLICNAASYLTAGTLEEIDLLGHQAEIEMFSEEEITFFDNCIGEFISNYSGTKISNPFDCHFGFSGSGFIQLKGRFKRSTLHQIDKGHTSSIVEIHGFDDISKELRCTIVEGDSEGKKIVLHSNSHEIFVLAAQGYINGTRFSCLFKEKVNIAGGKKIDELLAFNAINIDEKPKNL
tara:strand:- start:1046 stop:1894 length:849 start_codon:yes stop_codon:yes gene_type:complete